MQPHVANNCVTIDRMADAHCNASTTRSCEIVPGCDVYGNAHWVGWTVHSPRCYMALTTPHSAIVYSMLPPPSLPVPGHCRHDLPLLAAYRSIALHSARVVAKASTPIANFTTVR